MIVSFLALTVLTLIFSVFMSGFEVAFLSAAKAGDPASDASRPTSRLLAFFSQRPTWLIGTALIGNLVALILSGIFATGALLVAFDVTPGGSLSIAFIIGMILLMVVLYLFTVEFFSKSFFIVNSSQVLRILAWPFTVVFVVLFPIVFLVVSLSRLIVNQVFGLTYSKEKPVFGLTDVNQYLKTMHRKRPAEQSSAMDKKIFQNALEFKSVRIRDCMIPRTEIVAVSLDQGLEKLLEAFLESGHSKIIIYKDSIDDIVGYCHSAALFKKPQRIEEILTPIITIPETALARELMVRFINEHKSLAAVVDEFGGTSGIVSMEDVIEEIFGEIEDEHDEDTEIEIRLGKFTWLLSARLEIDYLNETYGWKLPTGDYDTLGGLILSYTEDLPKAGETISVPPYTLVVQSMKANRINTVRVIMSPLKPKN